VFDMFRRNIRNITFGRQLNRRGCDVEEERGGEMEAVIV
jgi:hypothetical protein